MNNKDKVIWESGHNFVARQTKEIEKTFKCSNPKPRNSAMGFWNEPRKPKYERKEKRKES